MSEIHDRPFGAGYRLNQERFAEELEDIRSTAATFSSDLAARRLAHLADQITSDALMLREASKRASKFNVREAEQLEGAITKFGSVFVEHHHRRSICMVSSVFSVLFHRLSVVVARGHKGSPVRSGFEAATSSASTSTVQESTGASSGVGFESGASGDTPDASNTSEGKWSA